MDVHLNTILPIFQFIHIVQIGGTSLGVKNSGHFSFQVKSDYFFFIWP
jgi:hypothetical protein